MILNTRLSIEMLVNAISIVLDYLNLNPLHLLLLSTIRGELCLKIL
jgi:hypothetical protein